MSTDSDPEETQEWVDSVDGLVAAIGTNRAGRILGRAVPRARAAGVDLCVG